MKLLLILLVSFGVLYIANGNFIPLALQVPNALLKDLGNVVPLNGVVPKNIMDILFPQQTASKQPAPLAPPSPVATNEAVQKETTDQ